MVTTTVRIPVDQWNWVKAKRGLELSSLLRRAITQEIQRDEEREAVDYIRQRRLEKGLPLVGPVPGSTQSP